MLRNVALETNDPFGRGLMGLGESVVKAGVGPIRHTSGISGGFRQLRIYDSAVMANFGTFMMRRE